MVRWGATAAVLVAGAAVLIAVVHTAAVHMLPLFAIELGMPPSYPNRLAVGEVRHPNEAWRGRSVRGAAVAAEVRYTLQWAQQRRQSEGRCPGCCRTCCTGTTTARSLAKLSGLRSGASCVSAHSGAANHQVWEPKP